MKEEKNNIMDIMEDAQQWALDVSGSGARTEKGKKIAITRYLKGRDLLTAYNAAVEEDKKKMEQHPLFARYFFATTPEIKKEYEPFRGTMDLPAHIRDVLQKSAFNYLFKKSRLKKKYCGNNSTIAQIRTEDNGKFGRKRRVWHYADYSAVMSSDANMIWFDIGAGYKLAPVTEIE